MMAACLFLHHPPLFISNSDDVEQIVAPFLTADLTISEPLSSISVMFAIYGMYIVVFGLSVHILLRRDGTTSRLYMWCTISLFVLATLYTAAYVWGMLRQAGLFFEAATKKNYTALVVYLTGSDKRTSTWFGVITLSSGIMNVVADSMLIHRCYIVWQSRIMLCLLSLIAVILNGIILGCDIVGVIGDSIPDFPLYAIGSIVQNAAAIGLAVFQVLMALLTGGRIWWISREARVLMGQTTDAKYKSIAAIIIESGIFYAAFLVTNVAIAFALDPSPNGRVPFDFGPVMTLMSGLAPTMIIVRVAYGTSVDSVQQMVSTLQFADAQGNCQRSRLTVDLQLRTQVGDHGIHSQSDANNSESLPIPATAEKAVEGSLAV